MQAEVEQPSSSPPQILVLGTLINRAFRLRLDDFISGLPAGSVITQIGEVRESRLSQVAQKYEYPLRTYPVEKREEAVRSAHLILAFPAKSKRGYVRDIIRQAQKLGIPTRVIEA